VLGHFSPSNALSGSVSQKVIQCGCVRVIPIGIDGCRLRRLNFVAADSILGLVFGGPKTFKELNYVGGMHALDLNVIRDAFYIEHDPVANRDTNFAVPSRVEFDV
jgi:hypothetical protein